MMNNFCSKYAIAEYGGDIVIAPCEETTSGIYPEYNLSVPILSGFSFNKTKVGNEEINAIIVDIVNKTLSFVQDSWDGFQYIGDDN